MHQHHLDVNEPAIGRNLSWFLEVAKIDARQGSTLNVDSIIHDAIGSRMSTLLMPMDAHEFRIPYQLRYH
jgi:hypothetical protein